MEAESTRITDRSWFERHSVRVAFDLIGCIIRVERDGLLASGRIVESEAYAGLEDTASHSSTRKNSAIMLSKEPGRIYTYLSYGIHTMANIVSHEPGKRGGVLLRAIEPVEGIEIMRARRGSVADALIGKGPGTVCQALGIHMSDMGTDLTTSDTMSLWRGEQVGNIASGERIGISKSVHAPWRFFLRGHPSVSAHRRGDIVTADTLGAIIPGDDIPLDEVFGT